MVLRQRKKSTKMRGSKTHGYGAKKKHRGKGNKGGFGYAGSHKHKWSHIVKYEPDHFGKKRLTGLYRKEKTINLFELEKMGEQVNLDKMGYTKLLGTGKITHKVDVVVRKWTKRAEEKIKELGGSVKTPYEGE